MLLDKLFLYKTAKRFIQTKGSDLISTTKNTGSSSGGIFGKGSKPETNGADKQKDPITKGRSSLVEKKMPPITDGTSNSSKKTGLMNPNNAN